MRKIITTVFLFAFLYSQAQTDSTFIKRIIPEAGNTDLNMDAVYNRPFLGMGSHPVSLGGYAEVNWQHLGTEGISDGHEFQMRRMTLFVASSFGKRLKFLSEIEFEEGGSSIAIEFASLDVEFHPLLNLRAGIVMNPIGAFNQNHDGPKWEFTDRPISATQMLPATWSTAGFGLFGKYHFEDWMVGYEVYLTGGFDNTIIDNEMNKTYLAASKADFTRFEESATGTPLTTGKVAVRHKTFGELGVSYMGGIYNTFKDDGEDIDDPRRLNVFALDYNTTLPGWNTFVTAEWAWVNVEMPGTYTQQYGRKQHGGFIDVVQPVLSGNLLGWNNATLNLACRLEYVDWNVGTFRETGRNIGDEIWRITPAITFRPSAQTVFRLNYLIQEQRDILDNVPEKTGGFSFGISTYF